MTLKEKIKEDMKEAFKAKDTQTRSTLSMLLAVIQNRELEKRSQLAKKGANESDAAAQSALTDDEVVDAIGTELKRRRESVTTYTEGGRPEMAAQEQAELEVLSRYLPEQLDESAVEAFIDEALASMGAAGPKDIGRVMGAVTPKTKGRFDSARILELVKQRLQA